LETLFYLVLPPIFYGVALQQSLEVLYSVLPVGSWQRYQKPISKIVAITVGGAWTAGRWGHGEAGLPPQWDDVLLAGLIAAASAELTNAGVKCLVYAKEARKAGAANALSTTGSISLESVSRK